ncbi:MAG: MFS transporter [Deltaproteobacteria bacterium]|nr:MFS transporter [Deltaproteobacteria bacterium]
MSDSEGAKSSGGLFSSFPANFWIVNVMELFERGAYYGMNSVLAVYLSSKDGLGFREDRVGFLQGLIYAMTYILPILGGALADRYGYRRMLLFAFSFISCGYAMTSQVTSYWLIFATLGLMAMGSGLFKPIISGTIARTTNEKNSGFGFGVYYWMINLGALIAPLVVYYLRKYSWNYVFIFSGLLTLSMLIPTIFFYRDPPKPKSTKKLSEVLGDALVVLSDSRFMLMIFIYSTFWILYFQNFGTVLWYLRDFVDPTPFNKFFQSTFGIKYSFSPEHVTVINAGTIVLLQVLISFITKRFKALPTMMVGMAIGALGFFFLALSQNVWIFILGIAIFSIGEMTCHPKYVSYIGLIAPQEKKATYMGYAFLYGVIGSLIGSNLGGEMYTRFMSPLVGKTGISSSLRNFWLVFGVLGLFSMGGLFLFNYFFGVNSEKTRSRAKKALVVVYGIFISTAVYFVISQIIGGKLIPKTLIQSIILLTLGVLGIRAILRKDENS